jgi:transposase
MTHVPGQKLFVDYSGKKLGIINPDTEEIRVAELFVAALGVSGLTFAELTWTQHLPDCVGSHVPAFAFYNGLVEILVPDNLKSCVHKPGSTIRASIQPTWKWPDITPWPSSQPEAKSPATSRKQSCRVY